MRIIKYTLKDIQNNKIICTIFFVLNIAMLFLVTSLFHVIDDTMENMHSIKTFETGYDNAYMIVDETTEEDFSKISSDTDLASKEYKQLFAELTKANIDYYTAFGYDIYVNNNGNNVKEQIITEQFINVFKFSIMQGRNFEAADFNTNNGVLPILIGYELQDKYKLGKEYEFEHGGTGDTFRGKVVGILRKSSKYYELNGLSVSLSLDFSYIVPQSTKNMDNLSFSDLDMAETRMVVFGDKNKIQKIFANTSPITVSLISVDNWIDEIMQNQKSALLLIGSVSILFLVFTLFITYIGFSRLFKKQMKEYKIHIFCGARNFHILIRFLSLSCLMLLIGILVVSAFYKSVEYTGKLIIFSICFSAVTNTYPYLVLKREMR